MRDSNFKSVSGNKAALSITTTLYDRRALDCTADRPLVNSLNHLTFLASSSAKVRETLANDGGIERLIDILHECRKPLMNNNNLLVAWKWTLAFQCLVLIGTRGTEKIRKKLVEAGMIPIIATVLDNYLLTHRTHDHQSSSSSSGSRSNTAEVSSAAMPQNNSDNDNTLRPEIRIRNAAISNPQTANTMDTPLPTAPNTANIHLNIINITNQGRDILIDPRNQTPQAADNQVNQNEGTAQDVDVTPAAGVHSDMGPNVLNSGINTNANNTNNNNDLGEIFQNILSMTPQDRNNHSNINSQNQSNQPLFDTESLLEEDINNMSRESLYRLLRHPTSSNDIAEIRRRYIISFLLRRLSEAEEMNESSIHSNILQPLLRNQHQNHSPIDSSSAELFANIQAPRNFQKGVLLPREDDIVWSLQLLAFISKYSYLKQNLQDTYLVGGMSLKSPPLDTFSATNNQVPGLDKDDDIDLDQENENDSDNASDMVNCFDKNVLLDDDNDGEVNEPVPYDNSKTGSPELLEPTKANTLLNNSNASVRINFNNANSSSEFENKSIFLAIKNAETITNNIEKAVEFVKINSKINKQIENDQNKIKYHKIQSRLKEKAILHKKWNYDTYSNFEVGPNDEDIDHSLQPLEKINIFPLVEKFTGKVQNNSDMYYWAGVIMRNSCRKDESRGGVRQCAHFDCGKWESYPREFAKCRRCKRTKYCSKECQMKAWHYHRHWCVQSNSSSSNAISGNTQNPHSRAGNTANNNNNINNNNNNNNNIDNNSMGDNSDTGTAEPENNLEDRDLNQLLLLDGRGGTVPGLNPIP